MLQSHYCNIENYKMNIVESVFSPGIGLHENVLQTI